MALILNRVDKGLIRAIPDKLISKVNEILVSHLFEIALKRLESLLPCKDVTLLVWTKKQIGYIESCPLFD
jgi:hypothetical protein